MGLTRTRIGIIGPRSSPQAEAVRDALLERGAEPLVVDTRAPSTIVFSPTRITVAGVPSDELAGAFVVALPPRQPLLARLVAEGRVDAPLDSATWLSGQRAGDAARDLTVTLLDAIAARGCPVINAPSGGTFVQQKLLDLKAARALGLAVPDTVVACARDALSAFIKACAARGAAVVTKPVRGGAAARRLQASDDGLIDDGVAVPVLLQEEIVGDDVRVILLDDEVLLASALDDTEAVDHREDRAYLAGRARYRPFLIDDATRGALAALMRLRGIRFAGADLIRARDGTLVFLELNAAPAFVEVAERLSVDVAGALASALCRAPSTLA